MKTSSSVTSTSRKTPEYCVWLVVLVIAWLWASYAQGQQRGSEQSVRSVVCRISNQIGGANNLGSGTLIDKTDDGREGLVLTCAHLFREGTGALVVAFADGSRHRARLIDVDHQADVAALSIANPKGLPAEIALDANAASRLYACGYGPKGIYRCAVGSAIGKASSAGQMSLLIDDPVRSGDSGGGVFDSQGRLVAVIWGEAEGVTYASYGKPLRSFLYRLIGQRSRRVYSCPNGVCPQQPARQPFFGGNSNAKLDERWAALQQQLDELRTQKQDRGDYVTRGELPEWSGYARREEIEQLEMQSQTRHAGLLDRLRAISSKTAGKAVGPAVVSLLGLSGPMGWAVLAAASVGGWLIGRHVNRNSDAGGRRWSRFRGSE